MPVQVRPDGPIPARVMIVGEAPGEQEEREGVPFVGVSGIELNKMLGEAGILRSECFITNVARERPYGNDIANFIATTKKDITPAHTTFREKYCLRPVIEGIGMLRAEILNVKPNVIIALGGTPLWALTGLNGIMRWRGSMLYADLVPGKIKVIPTYHPAAILRQWEWRSICVNDLKRAARFRDGKDYPNPGWNFRIRPTFSLVQAIFNDLELALETGPLRISFDLETKLGHIDCAGLAWSLQDSLCIPFMGKTSTENYWDAEEEAIIIWRLLCILTHRNAEVVGQNLLYDSQYTYRWWLFIPRITQDTMISWHVAFAGLKKSLDFQASMLCDYYKQWKPEKSAWKEGG